MNDNLIERLSDEADQCRNDGADDIAKLLDEARAAIERQSVPAGWYITKAEAMADAEEQAISAAAPQPQPEQQFELTEYDAGLLNDFGGGNVEWWQDYIRAELGRAYEHYRSQIPAQGEKQ